MIPFSKQDMAKLLTKKRLGRNFKNDILGETLGLLEEKEKNKDWVLEELKRRRVKLSVAPTENTYEILKASPKKFVKQIYHLLKGDELAVSEVQTLSKTYHWLFVDIISSANPKMTIKAQARKIRTLNEITKKTETFKQRDPNLTKIHWTGDGMAIGFPDSPEKPLRLAIELFKEITKHNKSTPKKNRIFIRIGMNTGDIFFIEDVEGRQAFWGDGIILARRVMDLCGPNQILASENIANGLRKLSPEYSSIIHPIEKYSIKHGEEVSIYNIYGKEFGNKKSPQLGKIQKLRPSDIVDSNTTSFKFKEVEIILDVKNSKTLMTHHTLIWKVENIRKDKDNPLMEIFYPIGGDTSKSMSDLNLRIRDDAGNKLKISSIIRDNPTLKEFYVKLKKPIRFNKKQTLTLEYDWEEPERKFEYLISTECEKLKYKLIIPKEMELKNRIYKVNPTTKEKINVIPLPDIESKRNKTIVIWNSEKKLKEHDTFEFNW